MLNMQTFYTDFLDVQGTMNLLNVIKSIKKSRTTFDKDKCQELSFWHEFVMFNETGRKV